MFVDFNILNQLGSPSINSNTFANRPAAGQTGRLFVSTDTFEIYRDNGTGWDLIGGPGSSTVTGSGATGQVTYWTGTNTVSGENALFWDAAQNHLGINTATPTVALDVHSAADVALQLNGTGATPSIFQQFLSAGVSQYQVGYNWNASADYRRFSIYDSQGSKEVISIDQQSRFVGINYQYSSLSDQPAYTLDVSGSGRFTDSAYFATVAGNKVGIGTSTPDRILTVYSGTADSRVLLQTQASGTGIASGFDLNIIYTSYGTYAQNDAQVWNYENAALVFATNNTERARFNNTGVFSINETSPYAGAKLIVKQASSYDGLYVNNSTSANNSISLYHTGTIGAIDVTYLGSGGYTPLTFWTNGLERVRVNTNGNTLIGTTVDAGQKLQVNGTTLISDKLTLFNNNSGTVDYLVIDDSGWTVGDRKRIAFNQSATTVAAIDAYNESAGQVGLRFSAYSSGLALDVLKLNSNSSAEFLGDIKTAAPTTGTAAAWKLGQRVAAAVVLDTTQYIQVEVGGTFYKLAIVT